MNTDRASILPQSAPSVSTSGRATIEAVDIARHYGHIVAVQDLSLHAVEGEILGVLGPNGAYGGEHGSPPVSGTIWPFEVNG